MSLIKALLIRLLAPGSFVVMTLMVTRFQSAELAGQLVTMLSVAIVVATFGRLGFDQLVSQQCIEFRSGSAVSRSILLTGLVVGIPLSLVGGVVLYFIWQHFQMPGSKVELTDTPLAFGLGAVLVVLHLAAATAQACNHTLRAVLIFPVLIYGATIIAVVLLELPLETGLGAGAALAFALAGVSALKPARLLPAKIDLAWIGASKYFAIISISSISYDWGVNIYIALMLGPHEVVIFALASRVAALLALPMTALTPYLMPQFAAMNSANDLHSIKKISIQTLLISIIFQLGAIWLIYVFGDALFDFASVSSKELVPCILVLAAAQMFNVLGGPAGSLLLMSRHERAVAALNLATAVIALVCGVIATIHWGVQGAASVVAAGLIFQNIGYNLLLYKHFGFVPVGQLGASLFGAMRNVLHRN